MALRLKEEGNKAFQSGKFAAAVQAYTDALALSPKDPVLYTNRALAHSKLQHWEPAATDSRLALQFDSSSVKGTGQDREARDFVAALSRFQHTLSWARPYCQWRTF
mmetsp:Transcript_17436/g.37847  ORF Transcript_17436/g.37847 Transcript_17436/m.37847 type:complete len:106 (+) Transcript_17436:2-319(+)